MNRHGIFLVLVNYNKYKPDKVADFLQLAVTVSMVASVAAVSFVVVSSWLDTCPMERHNIAAFQPV